MYEIKQKIYIIKLNLLGYRLFIDGYIFIFNIFWCFCYFVNELVEVL